MILADHALALRIEGAEAFWGRENTEVLQKLNPDLGAECKMIAGASVAFAGVGSPLSQALGLGLGVKVTAEDLYELEDFYRYRHCPVVLDLSPYADPGLKDMLSDRGYRILEFNNVLVRELDGTNGADLDEPPASEVNVAQVGVDEGETWVMTVARGFFEDEEAAQENLDIFIAMMGRRSTHCFLATVDGEPAGGGLVCVHEGVAGFYGTSTIPEFRARGSQAALIHARLEYARALGCDLALSVTLPGASSQRNLERRGFRTVYTKVQMIRTWE